MSELVIKNLHVGIEDNEILKGLELTVRPGEIHAIMGPNGTGKSTLAYALMGHPNYEVTDGEVLFKGENILDLDPDERSHLGLFLAFQYPVAIPGVTVANFLRTAINARRKAEDPDDKGMPIPEFRTMLKERMDMLKMDHSFAGRYLNDGFSGGEKSAPRFCKWQPFNLRLLFLTKPTQVWISTHFVLCLRVSMPCAAPILALW